MRTFWEDVRPPQTLTRNLSLAICFSTPVRPRQLHQSRTAILAAPRASLYLLTWPWNNELNHSPDSSHSPYTSHLPAVASALNKGPDWRHTFLFVIYNNKSDYSDAPVSFVCSFSLPLSCHIKAIDKRYRETASRYYSTSSVLYVV